MTLAVSTCAVTTSAPGKVILFGEHAVNRGHLALATAFGCRTTCSLTSRQDDRVSFRGAGRESVQTLSELKQHAAVLNAALARQEFAVIADVVRKDFFASSAYLLGRVALADALIPGMEISFVGELPVGGGLGSGGAAHAALAVAVASLCAELSNEAPSESSVSEWAYAGDCIAHGGTASALDTQTSLLGGVIEFRAGSPGQSLAVAPGLRLVIGDTGIKKGSTGSVNTRIRDWLAADPARHRYFDYMGALALVARDHLRTGNWPDLGALMDQNHALLATVGASHSQLDALCAAARAAGALGAKLTGAGGGGAMIALVTDRTAEPVAAAIRAAGGTTLEAPVAGAGATIESVTLS